MRIQSEGILLSIPSSILFSHLRRLSSFFEFAGLVIYQIYLRNFNTEWNQPVFALFDAKTY